MATLGDPTEVDRLALQIEALRAEISTLESHQKDIATIQSFNTKDLSKFKSGFRQKALKQAQIRRGELERLGVSHILPPPNLKTQTTVSGQKFKGGRGGEWDAYSNLSSEEKSRLRKNWMSETGHAPDQMALEMGVDSSDQAFETFLNHSRQIDLLEYYGKTGRMPKNFKGYGGKDLDSSFLDHLNIDLRILHDSDLTPTQQLDYLKEQMIGTTESEIDRYLPNGIRPIEDAVSENYKLQDMHKAHVQAMDQHLANRKEAIATYDAFFGEVFTDDPVSKPKTQAQINQEAAIARGRASKQTQAKPQSTLTVGKPVPQKTAPAKNQTQINLEAAKARGAVMDPAEYGEEAAEGVDWGVGEGISGTLDDGYFDSLMESVGDESFEAMASISSKSSAKRVAEAVVEKTPRVLSKSDTALSKLVSLSGEIGTKGENLRLGALATTLGLGAGYAAGRRRRKR